eukprot:scaffold34915_cov180-Amphora_coffeaeformis.AAC.8
MPDGLPLASESYYPIRWSRFWIVRLRLPYHERGLLILCRANALYRGGRSASQKRERDRVGLTRHEKRPAQKQQEDVADRGI